MMQRRKYSNKEKEKIRRMVKETGKKAEVAKKLGIPYKAVEKITWDIKVGNVITFG